MEANVLPFTIAYSNIQGGQDSIYVSDVENNQIHWQTETSTLIQIPECGGREL